MTTMSNTAIIVWTIDIIIITNYIPVLFTFQMKSQNYPAEVDQIFSQITFASLLEL